VQAITKESHKDHSKKRRLACARSCLVPALTCNNTVCLSVCARCPADARPYRPGEEVGEGRKAGAGQYCTSAGVRAQAPKSSPALAKGALRMLDKA
jgi:hypothetical protein